MKIINKSLGSIFIIVLFFVAFFSYVAPRQAFAAQAVGYIDSSSCTALSGWAYDPDYPNNAINIHIYYDGAYYDYVNASDPRSDLPGNGKHGFTYFIPEAWRNNTKHTINLYAIDLNGNGNPNLNYSPVTINCPPTTVNNAQLVSQGAPNTMVAGQTQIVTITVKNTGNTTWTSANGYKLGSQNPQDNSVWGTARASLDPAESIAPNGQKTFNFNITAPTTPGTYNFRWQMVKEGVAWFGDLTQNVSITVSRPTLPLVTTLAATDITQTTATLNATVESPGAAISERGVCFGGMSAYGPVNKYCRVVTGTDTGAFSFVFNKNMAIGALGNTFTDFYYRAYATNVFGTTYSTPDTRFSLLPDAPSVALSVSQNSRVVNMANPTLTWTVAGNATSCTASGDWSGNKSITGGSQIIGVLNTEKTYSYSLVCVNAGGSSNTATVSVIVGAVAITAPTINSVTISSPLIKADNATRYTITVQGTDLGGGEKITHEYADINFPVGNATNTNPGVYRGGVLWHYNANITDWNTYKNKQNCSGGGIAAVNNDSGSSYINLDSCTTIVSNNTRTTTFTVHFDPSFTAPAANNDIAGYVANIDGKDTGWTNFDVNFALPAPVDTCHTTNGVKVCHNVADESIFFNTLPTEVAYNVQNIRSGTNYTTIYHAEPKGKNAGFPGDSIKVGTQSGTYTYQMPSNRNFVLWGTQQDSKSAVYSENNTDSYKAISGGGNPMTVSGLPGDPYKYTFFLVVVDDNQNHQDGENDYRHYLLEARTLNYQSYEIRTGDSTWAPFNDQFNNHSCSDQNICPMRLKDTTGAFIRSNKKDDPNATQGLIGSISLVNGTYYYFYSDFEPGTQNFYLYYRTAADVGSSVRWSAAQKISSNDMGINVVRVAKAKGLNRWAVLYNCLNSQNWQDVCLQYTSNLNVVGTGGLSSLVIKNAFDGNNLGLKGVGGATDFSQPFWMTDTNGNLVSPAAEDNDPSRGGEIYWSDFANRCASSVPVAGCPVYGGDVFRAGWKVTAPDMNSVSVSTSATSPSSTSSAQTITDTTNVSPESTSATTTAVVPQNNIPTVVLVASPTSVVSGSASTISWTSTNATSCNVNGNGGISGSFSTGSIVFNRTYYGQCSGPGGTSQSASITVTIAPAITFSISTSSLPNAKVGTAYNTSVSAVGGSVSYGWSISSGSLPAGLQLTPVLCSTSPCQTPVNITGSPLAAGTSTFTITVTSGAKLVSKQFTLTVDPAIGLTASASSALDSATPPKATAANTSRDTQTSHQGAFHFTKFLEQGSYGKEVLELQKVLNNAGYDAGKTDKVFGAKVKAALIKFQTDNKLKADGIFGYEMRKFLNK